MTKKSKRIRILLASVLYLVMALFFVSGILIDQTHSFHKGNIEFENKKGYLKFAGSYNNITIDDSPGSSNNWAWAKTQLWCSGNGTLLDPFMIESHFLSVLNQDHGIIISNSQDKYFVIQNCTLQYDGGSALGFETVISLKNSTNGRILNNTGYSPSITIDAGIYIYQSENVIISNNTIYNTMAAISLSESNFSHIYENTAYSNEIGISLSLNSKLNSLYENIAYDNSDGISLSLSNNNTIYNNTVYSNVNGIQVSNSKFNEIYENIAYNNDDGILIGNSENNILEENQLNNNYDNGLNINNGHNNTILNNNVTFNTQVGINMIDSNENTISENEINNNTMSGIHLYNSQNNTISRSLISGNGIHGIFFQTNSVKNNISMNRIYYNSENGINLDYSNYLNIWNNDINNNGMDGIKSIEIESTTFYRNIIRNNVDRGVFLDAITADNVLYENFFRNNGKHAVDDGSSNHFNNTIIGNYWDNHTGPDTTPNDGIVDDPYSSIGGIAGTIDNLPIAEDGPPTIIINSPDPNDPFSNVSPSFNVKITDDYLDEMWYTIDGGLNNFTFTDNGTIDQIAWNALSEGSLTLEFYASDIPGNIGTAKVIIDKDTQLPIINITSPTLGDKFGVNAPSFILTVIEDHMGTLWYSIDGGLNNYTITTNGTIDQSAWDALLDGVVTLEFYVNDTLGNIRGINVVIEKDSQAPIITINSPNDGDVFGALPPSFNLNISDPNLDSIWLSINGMIINFNPAILDTINQTAWLALPEGNISIIIYANDTLGNNASEILMIIKNIPSTGGIGLDYFMTSFLLFSIGGIAVIIVITRIYSKRKLIS